MEGARDRIAPMAIVHLTKLNIRNVFQNFWNWNLHGHRPRRTFRAYGQGSVNRASVYVCLLHLQRWTRCAKPRRKLSGWAPANKESCTNISTIHHGKKTSDVWIPEGKRTAQCFVSYYDLNVLQRHDLKKKTHGVGRRAAHGTPWCKP